MYICTYYTCMLYIYIIILFAKTKTRTWATGLRFIVFSYRNMSAYMKYFYLSPCYRCTCDTWKERDDGKKIRNNNCRPRTIGVQLQRWYILSFQSGHNIILYIVNIIHVLKHIRHACVHIYTYRLGTCACVCIDVLLRHRRHVYGV